MPALPPPPPSAPAVGPPPRGALDEDDGEVTATVGDASCLLTEELPEGERLPHAAAVVTRGGASYAVMRTMPSGRVFTCKLVAEEEGEDDRRR